MRRTLVTVLLAAGAGAAAWVVVGAHGMDDGGQQPATRAESAPAAGAASPAIPDWHLGLSRTRVTDDPVPAPFVYSEQGPGESERLPRPYEGAPPLIPHSLEGLIPITREENACVMCHATGEPTDDGPPHAPASHFVDQRNAPDAVREEVAGARWVCTSCHVPQSDATLLVGSAFGQQ